MLKNFLTIAIRSFVRQRFYSILNLIGLTTGLACALFIFLWVREEVGMNKFHKDLEKIFILKANYSSQSGEIVTWNDTPGPLAEYINESVPAVKLTARTFPDRSTLFHVDDKSFLQDGLYADPELFKIFSFRIKNGALPKNKLDKTSLMISETLARKLFGDTDPVGKQVVMNTDDAMVIAAVFEDISVSSSLKFDFILPLERYKELRGDGFTWGNFDHHTYIKLNDSQDADQVVRLINQKFTAIVEAEHEMQSIKFIMQPFADTWLHSEFRDGKIAGGRIEYVRIFIVVAVFILLIACVNFTNMATARAVNRSKEIGMRKVVGAQRTSIVLQFLGESLLISLLAMLVAVMFVYMALPVFNIIVSKKISLDLADPVFILSAFGIVLVTGITAGSYPAFVLSSFLPVSVLKGILLQNGKGVSLRRALVGFQFSLTIILVISSIVIYQQIAFIRSRGLGYDRSFVMTFPARGGITRSFDAFKEDAKHVGGVTDISRADQSLVLLANQSASVVWPGKTKENQQLFQIVNVDFDYLETMNVSLTDGRLFSRKFNDTSNFVLTELAADRMGLDRPLGQKISVWQRSGTVVGTVRNVQASSMEKQLQPIIFACHPEWASQISLRFEPGRTKDVIAGMTTVFKKYSPQYPFTYTFLEDEFENLYETESITGTLALGFTTMAIIISGLGLLGLAAYTTERKRKEISVRKTLGASVAGLVTDITKDFMKLSFIAALIGCPVAWYAMSKFLDRYAYHTEFGWDVLGLAVILITALSGLTVMYQVVKAAAANPVDALRNE